MEPSCDSETWSLNWSSGRSDSKVMSWKGQSIARAAPVGNLNPEYSGAAKVSDHPPDR
jgi:hypothetical protein